MGAQMLAEMEYTSHARSCRLSLLRRALAVSQWPFLCDAASLPSSPLPGRGIEGEI